MKNTLLAFIFLTAVSCSRPSESEEEHHAPAAGEPTAIEMSSEAQSHIGLQVAPVEKKVLTELELKSPISATAVAANGVLYIATMQNLYAVKQ